MANINVLLSDEVSLLDMKRFVTAIGLESGGYRGEFSDLVKLG